MLGHTGEEGRGLMAYGLVEIYGFILRAAGAAKRFQREQVGLIIYVCFDVHGARHW